jgi:hypothetical protein
MHALLTLLTKRPQLLAEHAQGYVDLLALELPRAAAAYKHTLLLNVLGLLGLQATLLLACVGLMLWASLPASAMPAAWLLIVVPLLPLAATLACLSAARGGVARNSLAIVQQQLSADLAMLREGRSTP